MIRDYFNERAAGWDNYASERDADKLERMVNRLNLKPGMTVLDIGTGTGVFLPYLLKITGSNSRVIALDIAEKMLRQAQEKGISDKIDYLCAGAEDIPLEPETCDAVVCYSSFPHFQDKPKALKEIRRVLKKGGRAFICHTSGREAINRIHRNIPLLHHDVLPDAGMMKKLLEAAGFVLIRIEDEAESYFARGEKPAQG